MNMIYVTNRNKSTIVNGYNFSTKQLTRFAISWITTNTKWQIGTLYVLKERDNSLETKYWQ